MATQSFFDTHSIIGSTHSTACGAHSSARGAHSATLAHEVPFSEHTVPFVEHTVLLVEHTVPLVPTSTDEAVVFPPPNLKMPNNAFLADKTVPNALPLQKLYEFSRSPLELTGCINDAAHCAVFFYISRVLTCAKSWL